MSPRSSGPRSTSTQQALVADAVARLRASGLLAATVPARLGGPELPASVIAEVLRILATGDGSLGQIPQSHFVFTRWLFTGTHPHAERRWADLLLDGTLVANAQAEREPTVLQDGRLTGEKIFCTGSAYADVLAITARRPGEDRQSLVVFLPADTAGIRVLDDWGERSPLGQEFTASGTVVLDNVAVPPDAVRAFDTQSGPAAYGAFAQLLHTAIDVGISGAALDAALALSRDGSFAPAAGPDPVTAHLAGDLVAAQFAAEAVLEKAGRAVNAVWAQDGPSAAASLAVAAAKATTGELTVDLASRLFELTGTRGVTGPGGDLARHWRDLRTHTLHERRRDKLVVLGRAALTGEDPVPGPQL
ncbi:acyl-CoA dehydrogenase family protein [Corynebacterium sp. AOP40-9SA-29]|uniref:acyl-CoA dehydrogenase family protein n=1 Tax=Corynebacterium sp. AOP40-9SA-29 TaxID=3457677 RepID=UPI004034CC7F